ncbi:hypothetical protein Tco_0357954, partial [Tanacetum coccineum]
MLKTVVVNFEIRTIWMRQFGCAIRKNLGNSERTRPSGLELSGENLQSGVEKQDMITNIEDSILYLGSVKYL